ncbi:TRAM domain-containing protein [Candidatus Saccharibacteria bacterium]|nr:TRAM domain-containing protein [Candidatus Saccharibacteria bacterium]
MNEIIHYVLFGLVLFLLSLVLLRQPGQKRIARGSILLDTSSIMDGRIIDVAATGVLTAELIIPRSVIREMQLLADKADHEKRARARAGLENVKKLQKLETVAVSIVNDGFAEKGVDERLLELAAKYDASIATIDFNLNKVAKTMDITVINVNELAQVLRMQYLPGERLEVQVSSTGQNRDQGVGYLDDGTMIVIEGGKSLVGQKVRIEVVRSLQTEAGRMMFANVLKAQPPRRQNGAHKKPQQQPRKTYRSGKPRRRTPEDSLIEAANGQTRENRR